MESERRSTAAVLVHASHHGRLAWAGRLGYYKSYLATRLVRPPTPDRLPQITPTRNPGPEAQTAQHTLSPEPHTGRRFLV